MKKYLVALNQRPSVKTFNCQTVLVSAKDEDDAWDLAKHLRPNHRIGYIKQVNY